MLCLSVYCGTIPVDSDSACDAGVPAQKRELKRASRTRKGGADNFPYVDGGADASPGCALALRTFLPSQRAQSVVFHLYYGTSQPQLQSPPPP